ncbi:MAG: CoA transferase [Alphaproteobacteria bacterium]|nr:CoA transferase [Alphaproteobacteria bacterium]
MAGVLSGIRVLDFGRYIAGPYCATLLGHLGAEVIRIEKLAGGEDRYVYPLSWDDDGREREGSMFLQTGANKKSVALNPIKPEGREIVKKLVKTADVVVVNLPKPALENMGLDYASLSAIKPDIILTNISTFGPRGPYANRGGFDGIAQVMSGAAWFSGEEGKPMKSNAPWVDFGTAQFSAFGTLAAIMHKQQTGEGQEVEGALLRTGLTFMNGLLGEQAILGLNRQPTGNRVQTSAPSDIFATKDGHILTHTVGNGLFRRWAQMIGEEEKWADDPRFQSDQTRGNHRDEICARMADWCAERTTDEALAACTEHGVPAGPVLTAQQALENEQVQAMGDLEPIEYPNVDKPVPTMGLPVRMSKSETGHRMRAPLLGEHTDEIMTELGYSAEEMKKLREGRIIG